MIKDPQEGDRVKKKKGEYLTTIKKGTITNLFGGPDHTLLGYCKFDVEWDENRHGVTTHFRDEVSPIK